MAWFPEVQIYSSLLLLMCVYVCACAALVAYWVAKLYPDRCNGIIMLNSGFTSGKFSKVEEALRAEIDIVANKQHSDANAYFRELTGMKDASLDQLPLNGQERFKYEYANRPDSALLGRDLAAMKKYLNSMDEMMKGASMLLLMLLCETTDDECQFTPLYCEQFAIRSLQCDPSMASPRTRLLSWTARQALTLKSR